MEQLRGAARLEAVILGTLGVVFFGLWWWAQTNAFAAALTALLLFATVLLVQALIEPKSLVSGLIVKGVIMVALFSAVSAGHRERAYARRR